LKRGAPAAFAACLLFAASGIAAAQDSGGLLGGFFGGSDRTQGESTGQDYSGPTAQTSGADLVVRLERMENQIRKLTGTIEQLQFRTQQLEQQLRRNQEDVEYRFQELGGKGGSRPRAAPQPAPPAVTTPAPAPDPRRRSDVFDPREDPNAPGAPRTLGATASSGAPPPIAVEEPGGPGGSPAGAPLDLSTLADRAAHDPTLGAGLSAAPVRGGPASTLPAPPPSNPNATSGQRTAMLPPNASPQEEFAVAQAFVQQKDYAMAEDAFRQFLQKHPNDRLVADAHYWLGESLFQRHRYRDAAESFLAVSTKHEKSGKAPEALLRLGQSLAALGEKEASCATFAEVQRKFPKAGSVKQSAEREQKRGRC
jgi:tol-pal system protein YbgF